MFKCQIKPMNNNSVCKLSKARTQCISSSIHIHICQIWLLIGGDIHIYLWILHKTHGKIMAFKCKGILSWTVWSVFVVGGKISSHYNSTSWDPEFSSQFYSNASKMFHDTSVWTQVLAAVSKNSYHHYHLAVFLSTAYGGREWVPTCF